MAEVPHRPRMRRSDFERATGRGERIVTPLFLVFILARDDGHGARLGITVTRKVGNAVRRNRIKRLAREWFRSRRPDLGSLDLVLIARRDIPCPPRLGDLVPHLDRAVQARRCSSA